MMGISTVLVLFLSITCSLATKPSPSSVPTVDLGYEIHQATFNVRNSIPHSTRLLLYCTLLY